MQGPAETGAVTGLHLGEQLVVEAVQFGQVVVGQPDLALPMILTIMTCRP